MGVWNSKKPWPFMRARMASMMAPRVMMFLCSFSRRRVEEAILEAGLFRIFHIAEHRQRQLGGGAQHFQRGGVDLHRPSGEVGVLRALGAQAHLAVDADDPFRAGLLGVLEGGAVGVHHHLGEAVMVAQVDEQHAAVVADAVAPAGKPDLLADLGGGERAAGVGAIAVHRICPFKAEAGGTRGHGPSGERPRAAGRRAQPPQVSIPRRPERSRAAPRNVRA